jgi:hypothetical protein
MKIEVISDSLKRIKQLLLELTGFEVMDVYSQTKEQYDLYVVSNGIEINNANHLTENEGEIIDNLLCKETLEIFSIDYNSYEKLKKIFFILKTGYASNCFKESGLGRMQIHLGAQQSFNTDGVPIPYNSIQMSINYAARVQYNEVEKNFIIEYAIQDKEKNIKIEGEIKNDSE